MVVSCSRSIAGPSDGNGERELEVRRKASPAKYFYVSILGNCVLFNAPIVPEFVPYFGVGIKDGVGIGHSGANKSSLPSTSQLRELLQVPAKGKNATPALQMNKLDLKGLQQAY